MKKDIRNYLHLYLGCEVVWTTEGDKEILSAYWLHKIMVNDWWNVVKPILRRLSDMPIKDKEFYGNRATFDAMEFKWLLEQGFDLFGLIEDGLAIDAATLK